MSKLQKEIPGTTSTQEAISKLKRTPEEQIADLTKRLAAAEDTIASLQEKVDRLLNHTHDVRLNFAQPWWPVSQPPPPNDSVLIAFAVGSALNSNKRTTPPNF